MAMSERELRNLAAGQSAQTMRIIAAKFRHIDRVINGDRSQDDRPETERSTTEPSAGPIVARNRAERRGKMKARGMFKRRKG